MNADVIIVGGGIAGLTTALALSRANIASLILERSNFEDESGAGIQLTPNATRVLFQLGLKTPLVNAAHEPSGLVSRHWRTGKVLNKVPLQTIIAKYCTSPYLQIRRADLVNTLLQQCRRQANVELLSGVEITKIDQTNERVYIGSAQREFSAPLIVGADGVHSKISKLIGNRNKPKFSGWQAWRTILYDPKLTNSNLESTNIWCGREGHIVHYPVNSKQAYNCVFVTKSAESISGRWKQYGSVSELKKYFQSWNCEVTQLIDQIDQGSLFRWGLYHHARMKNSWSSHRIVLLGDAIHATMPYLAQGAALAIEDAMALANRMKTHHLNVPKVIELFVAYRQHRVERIQNRSEIIGSIYHAALPWSIVRDMGTRFAIHRLVQDIYNFETV